MTTTADIEAPPVAEAERPLSKIFAYSTWVHVAPDDCPLVKALAEAPDAPVKDLPKCTNDEHFHAWIRLPNPYQTRDINEKARAARARVLRMLRDPESDAAVILEDELEALKDERVKATLVEEILNKDFADHYDQAVAEVLDYEDPTWAPSDDDDDDEPRKLYAHVDADQEEYARQKLLEPEQRDETFAELEATVARFATAVEEELDKIRTPLKERLLARDQADLVDIVRRDRIEQRGQEMYLHTWNTWQWYVCTYRKPRGDRYFKDINDFKYNTPPQVVAELQARFHELERELNAGVGSGNS